MGWPQAMSPVNELLERNYPEPIEILNNLGQMHGQSPIRILCFCVCFSVLQCRVSQVPFQITNVILYTNALGGNDQVVLHRHRGCAAAWPRWLGIAIARVLHLENTILKSR
jgi:hypothetical protein